MITATIIADSLRSGTALDLARWRITKLYRAAVDSTSAQPRVWTVMTLEAEESQADSLAAFLAGHLMPEGGWYADFRVGDEHIVVFAHKVFRYRRGDHVGRAAAEQYGRSVGVPTQQLDWPD